MNTKKPALLFAAALLCMGAACPTKIKTTSFIVVPNSSSLPGISASGTLKWLATSDSVRPFHVYLFPADFNPCASSTLNGSYGHPATCKIGPGMEGIYGYIVAPETPGGTSTPPQGTMLYAHVDACNPLCPPGSQVVIKSAPTSQANPPIAVISCDSQNATVVNPEPTPLSSGQQVQWAPLGPAAKITWQVTFKPPAICVDGTTQFGTGTQAACTISGDAKPGKYPYDIVYTNTVSGKTCKGTDQLTVTAASSVQ